MSGHSERQSLDPRTPWWGIHMARYQLAASYVRNLLTLDIACGTGYGLSALHAAGARRVIGVEKDPLTAQVAKQQLNDNAGAVIIADGSDLPFPNSQFEAIISLETIEHLNDRQGFLSELNRILQPSGICLISTPNANYSQPVDGVPKNPFHVHEYSPEELLSELGEYFSNIQVLGQTLNPRFTISPFWDDQKRLPKTLKFQSRLLLWRVINKFPATIKERLGQLLLGHPLTPDQDDYDFSPATVADAAVLVALCRSPRDR